MVAGLGGLLGDYCFWCVLIAVILAVDLVFGGLFLYRFGGLCYLGGFRGLLFGFAFGWRAY